MKTWKDKKWFIVCLLLLGTIAAKAQFTETREFEKRFKIESDTRIEITNKYGRIDVFTWKKDSVYFKVEMKVEEKKLSKLEKTLDGIDFDFSNSPHYLIARTIVGENQTSLSKEFIKFKETLLQTDGNVTIDYKVYLPENHEVNIENKFGDILMDNYNGKLDINLSNGKLRAKTLTGKLTLNLNFADATIGNIENGRLYTNYSDMYIKQSDQLRIDSKSSTIEILETQTLDIESRRDKYRIRLIDEIEANGNFSHFILNNLNKKAKFRTSFGDIDMENIDPKFENIYIESKSTDMNLYFDLDSNFNFEVTESKTQLDFDREIKVNDSTELDSKEKKNRHKCTFGEKTTGSEKLIINSVSGEINILSN